SGPRAAAGGHVYTHQWARVHGNRLCREIPLDCPLRRVSEMIMAAGWSGPFFDGVGDAATWVGAIGTLAAFVVAFWQIRRERHHRLTEQLRQRRLAHREHADRVSAWITGGDLVISNMSEHPIHDVEAVLESARSTGHGVDEQIDRRTLT